MINKSLKLNYIYETNSVSVFCLINLNSLKETAHFKIVPIFNSFPHTIFPILYYGFCRNYCQLFNLSDYLLATNYDIILSDM